MNSVLQLCTDLCQFRTLGIWILGSKLIKIIIWCNMYTAIYYWTGNNRNHRKIISTLYTIVKLAPTNAYVQKEEYIYKKLSLYLFFIRWSFVETLSCCSYSSWALTVPPLMSSMMSWGWQSSTLLCTYCAVPRISLIVLESSSGKTSPTSIRQCWQSHQSGIPMVSNAFLLFPASWWLHEGLLTRMKAEGTYLAWVCSKWPVSLSVSDLSNHQLLGQGHHWHLGGKTWEMDP